MTKTRLTLLSSFLFLIIGCRNEALDVDLQDKTIKILECFSKEQKSYLDTLSFYHEPVFYYLQVTKEHSQLRLQVYLIENRLNDYVEDFKAYSNFNGYDVVIYGDLNSLFFKIDKSKKTSYIHKYGNSGDYIYDPPYLNLYFDERGKLIKTSPEEFYYNLDIEKVK